MYLMDPPSHEGILGKKNLINNLLLNLLTIILVIHYSYNFLVEYVNTISPFWRIGFGSFQFILLYNWLYKTCTMIQWICEKFRPKTLQAYINQLWQGKLWTNEAGLFNCICLHSIFCSSSFQALHKLWWGIPCMQW